jgi:flagellar hook-associated protein 2
MTTISNLGVGSGLDLGSLLTSLTKAESAPLAAIQQQQASYTSKLSAYGQLNGAISALQTAAAALAKPAVFQGVTASSTATDVLTATALSSAQSGTYAVNVTQLSQAQSLATTGVAAAATYGVATLAFEFGTVGAGIFTADGTDRNDSIAIAASSTLADIAKAINANTTLGATASVINNGDPTKPNQLVLTSKRTGETSIMKVTVTGDANLSTLMTYDPLAVPNLEMHETAAALNTKLTVNGIPIISATNTVAGAVQDITMTVAKLGVSTLSVRSDTASAETAVAAFVTAYNSLQNIAAKLTAFDPTSKSGATLLGDATLRNIQTRIRSVLTSAQAADSSGLTTLSQIGLSVQKDGTLAVDSTKLTAALGSKLTGVAHLFSGASGVGGYGTQLSSLLTGFTDTNGMLTSATKGMTKSLVELGRQYEVTSERIDVTIARYKAQFTKLDVMISSMNQTSSYLTQQFDAMNSSNNK